jgi:putative endonuclease
MNTRAIGNKGEYIACAFLSHRGYAIIDRNFLKSWGELDIIAKYGQEVHFFEVKSVTYTESPRGAFHRPEDNVHGLKVRSIGRMIETYLAEKGYSTETEFNFHVLCVFMDLKRRRARVKWLRNVIL